MKYSSLLWCLILAAAMAIGCERQQPSDEKPVFDPDLDAVGGIIEVDPDESLVEDQGQISRAIERTKPVAAAPGGFGVPAGTTPVDQVRANILAVVQSVQAGDMEAMLTLFTDDAAAQLQPLVAAQQQLAAKGDQLAQLVQANLGMELPPEINPAEQMRQQFVGGLSAATTDAVSFDMDGENVVITTNGPNGSQTVFVPVDGQYKALLPAELEQQLPLLTEMVTATESFLDQMITGIEGGTITQANFQAQSAQIVSQTITPVMMKMLGAAPQPGEEVNMPPMPEAAPAENAPGNNGFGPGDPRPANMQPETGGDPRPANMQPETGGDPRPANMQPETGGDPRPRMGGTLNRMVNPLEGADEAGL